MVGNASFPPSAQNDWAYFLDFDGTLLELAITPDAIRVDTELPVLLASLHRACAGAVALVSGRSLSDLDRRIDVPWLPKAGQHGLERRDANGHLCLHGPPLQAKKSIQKALMPVLKRHVGLLLEDKGLSLALHYRQVPELAFYVRHLAHRLVNENGEGLLVQEGKEVVEIKPAGIDKGTAIAEYLAELPFVGRRPVFVGDDQSDEHGFAVVNERDGVSIGVGLTAGSSARYRLTSVGEVRSWLSGALRN